MINRKVESLIIRRFSDSKAIIILGPRQVGKTTLLKKTLGSKGKVSWWNGDESDIRQLLYEPTSASIRHLIGPDKIIVIDEAQRIPQVGIVIKLIVDNIPDVKVLAAGSSSFDLSSEISESLTGRKWEFRLYPFSFSEMVDHHGVLKERRNLDHRLVYGYYPDVVNNPGDEEAILHQLVDSYLYKDILALRTIRKPQALNQLLQALAFQVGSQVSYSELAGISGLDNETVETYIDLLEKGFVVFRLPSYSRNLRNELKKSKKIYFYDNGVRNALINQFNPLKTRNDKGPLWENFLVSERRKYLDYSEKRMNSFFWRTSRQQEIDYIEESGGELSAFEFKWNSTKKARLPKTFLDAYPESDASIIHPQNFEPFVGC